MARYALLVFLWIVWCFLHSVLISRPVTGFIQKHIGRAYRFYRIFYNLAAAATLIPVLYYTYLIQGVPIFRWEGPLMIVRVLAMATALLLFIAGARRYDLAQFLGIRQVKDNNTCSALTADCSLDAGGVLDMVRHPWYTGGIILIWARSLDVSAILTNLVVTAYFVVGAVVEERKLVLQFGEQYTAYQQRVSMWLPVKWARRKFFAKKRV